VPQAPPDLSADAREHREHGDRDVVAPVLIHDPIKAAGYRADRSGIVSSIDAATSLAVLGDKMQAGS
jgi:hypothetical protein